jgi:hypothetical protein
VPDVLRKSLLYFQGRKHPCSELINTNVLEETAVFIFGV